MTVEQIEIRKILTQMLADAGINRETIKDIVRDVIEEKVEKAIDTVCHQSNIASDVQRHWDQYVRSGIADAARNAVREQVKGYFQNISVTLNFGGPEPNTAE